MSETNGFYAKYFVAENAQRRLLSEQIAQARYELALNVRKIPRDRWIELSHMIDEVEYSELVVETTEKRLS